MRHLNKRFCCVIYIILLGALLIIPGMAADSTTFSTGNGGLNIIKEFEGFQGSRFEDVDGSWRIGYGSDYELAEKKFPDNEKDDDGYITITQDQALELLKENMTGYEQIVNSYLRQHSITVNQNQFDALVSFTYNMGGAWTTGQNEDKTPYKIREMLEKKPPEQWTEEEVQAAFGSWINAGGKPSEGLKRRRAAEAKLFLTPYEPGAAEKPSFIDVPADTWYTELVEEVYDLGLMQGMGDGIFDPEGKVTRAQMVKVLANFAGADLTAYQNITMFSDVSLDDWYAPVVAWAADHGIVNGMGDGTFQPEEPIRREHICNIIARYLKGTGISAGNIQLSFQDTADIEPDARENVDYCVSLGLINGMGDGTFAPKEQAQRAQLAKILVSMIRLD